LISHERFTACAERRRVAPDERGQMGLDPVQEIRIRDRPVLDDLGQTGRDLALRQRPQRIQVGNHAQRLVEGADHVLAERMVDRRLAADRRVHLRQQRGRHLHERTPRM
jgi:hypothetical protein